MSIRVHATILAGALATLTLSTGAHGGAWTMEKGHGQILATATPSWADSVFTASRDRVAGPSYNKFEAQMLFEYGLTDQLTIIVTPGFQRVAIGNPTNATRTGLGYTDAGARYRLLQGDNWVLSGQGTVRFPGAYDTANPAAIGSTGIETDLRALGGMSFGVWGVPTYVDLQLAQRFRSNGPPNEFRADLTIGVRPYPQWLVLAQSYNVFAEGAGDLIFPAYDYQKLQLGLAYDITPQWSVIAAIFTTLTGRNALQEDGVMLGAWYRF